MSQDIRPALEEKNHEMNKQLEKRREKKWKKFMGCPDYGYYTPKTESLKEKNLKSRSPKQVTVNDTQSHRNVTVRKKNKRSYAEIVKLNNSQRTEKKQRNIRYWIK